MTPDRTMHPMQVFSNWMSEAQQNSQIVEPTAMTLCTLSPSNLPHARVVLCKGWGEDGFTFYTNYNSKKGIDLAAHAQVAGVFYWGPLARQVKFSALAKKTTRAESEAYWASRPRESQISQYLSKQSQVIEAGVSLKDLWKSTQDRFQDQEIPCPAHWGGYNLNCQEIEFWIGREGRLHERYLYKKSPPVWTFASLYP